MQAESESRVGDTVGETVVDTVGETVVDTVGETVGDSEIKHCQKSTVSIVIVSGVPSVQEVQIDEIAVPTTHGVAQGAKSEHTSGFSERIL